MRNIKPYEPSRQEIRDYIARGFGNPCSLIAIHIAGMSDEKLEGILEVEEPSSEVKIEDLGL